MNPIHAQQLTSNPAFEAVFDEYITDMFRQWLACTDPDAREEMHLKARLAREVCQEIKNQVTANGNLARIQ